MMRILFTCILFFITTFVYSQFLFVENLNGNVLATKDKNKTVNLLLNHDVKDKIILDKNDSFFLEIPFINNQSLKVRLDKFSVFSDNLMIQSVEENDVLTTLLEHPDILTYKMTYEEEVIGVLNLFNGHLNACFSVNGLQYEISRFKDSYVLFESSNSINSHNFSCEIEEVSESYMQNISPSSSSSTPVCLEVAVEIDNYTRNTFNSNIEATNWALAIFAGVSQIYESEMNVALQVSYLNIWNTVDPYDSYVNQASNMLSEIRTYWTSNNGSVIRDVVHLLSKRTNTGTGGIAYLDVLCNNNWGYGFSSALNNDTTYSFPNPTYTWNLNVVSHEIGHNFGAEHTHDCDWLPDPFYGFAGGPIDNCVDVQGSCPNNPSPQIGTIMSYCHTVSGGGVVLEFHDIVVSQALIPGRDNAFCLTICDFYGCTDTSAYNYDPLATIDDGSCIPVLYGCTDTSALNYDSSANTDDGTCTYCSMLTFNVSDVSCFGYNDASIDLVVFGGSSPFNYAWSGSGGFSSNTQDLSNLSPGLYSIVVTDDNGCAESSSVTVSEPTPIYISGTNVIDVSCNGYADGSAILLVSGGTPPYTEDWLGYNANSLAAGNYLALVSDSNNCPVDSVNVTINEPSPISVLPNVSNITCYGYNDGSIDLTIFGGNLPYNYNWSSSNGYFSINEDINGLQDGVYVVVITDFNGCVDTFSYSISEPSQLILNSLVTPASCYGATDGSIDLIVSGGGPPYNFIWSNGSTSEDLINVPSSNYWVNVVDNNQCAISTQYFSVSQPPAPVVSSTQQDVSCYGFSDGEIDVSFSSSLTPVTYSWTGPNGFSSNFEDITGLFFGPYILIINYGPCLVTQNYYVTQPGILSVSESINHVACFGGMDGQVNLTISGGTPPFSQDWFGEDPNALSAGNFQYEIIDSNNCTLMNNVVILEPSAPIAVTSTVTDVSCYGGNNGTAQLNISGGTPSYITIWQNANPLQLSSGYNLFSILDDNQCSYVDSVYILEPSPLLVLESINHVTCNGGSDGSVQLNISGGTYPYYENWGIYNNLSLSSGSYIYQVYDSNSCMYTSLVNISEPLPISVISNITNSTCVYSNDGSVYTTVSGGTPPYIEDWLSVNPHQLSAGSYMYVIIDSFQCLDTQQVIINSTSNISVQATIENISCFGFCDGNVSLNISGGITPYLINWFSNRPDSLCPGDYAYNITDSLQCIYEDTIEILETSLITASISQQTNQLFCNVFGGTPPYSYQWWNSNGLLGTFSSQFAFDPGQYYCIVFDQNQCHSDTLSYFVGDILSTSQANLLDIEIYPNPFSEEIDIIFPHAEKRDVQLFDDIGRLVYNIRSFGEEIIIDTKELSSGMYLIQINTNESMYYKKVFKY